MPSANDSLGLFFRGYDDRMHLCSGVESPMEYLSVDVSKLKPLAEPYGKTFWSPSPEQATPFGSQGEADAWKKATSDATGVTEINDRWYVVKE